MPKQQKQCYLCKKNVSTKYQKNTTYSFFRQTPEIYYKAPVPASSLAFPYYPLSNSVDARYYSILD